MSKSKWIIGATVEAIVDLEGVVKKGHWGDRQAWINPERGITVPAGSRGMIGYRDEKDGCFGVKFDCDPITNFYFDDNSDYTNAVLKLAKETE